MSKLVKLKIIKICIIVFAFFYLGAVVTAFFDKTMQIFALEQEMKKNQEMEFETGKITGEVDKPMRNLKLNIIGETTNFRNLRSTISNNAFSINEKNKRSNFYLGDVPEKAFSIFTYMPQFDQKLYRYKLDKNSRQYKFNKKCYTDKDGFRKYGNSYLVALGTYFGSRIGDKYLVRVEQSVDEKTGKKLKKKKIKEISVVLGDVKSDRHTDRSHKYCNVYKSTPHILEAIMGSRANHNPRVKRKFQKILSISKNSSDININGNVSGSYNSGKITIKGQINYLPFIAAGTIKNGKISGEYMLGDTAELGNEGVFKFPLLRKFPVTSPFGWRTAPTAGATARHDGIDYGAPHGEPVVASKSGTVIAAQFFQGRGLTVMVKHAHGFTTVYQHLSKLNVRKGERIRQRKVVGNVGTTGASTGAHLHFEIWKNNKPVNPARYVK